MQFEDWYHARSLWFADGKVCVSLDSRLIAYPDIEWRDAVEQWSKAKLQRTKDNLAEMDRIWAKNQEEISQ